MKNTKILIILLGVVLLTWLLPQLFTLLIPTKVNTPFVLYSELDSSFICSEIVDGRSVIRDFKGNRFTKRQCDSLLPFFFYRQLMADGRMPDSVLGHEVTKKDLQKYYFYMKTSPKHLNRPQIGLYTMFESESGNVDLYLPPDVFRVKKNGLEFIDCRSNNILSEKSELFTKSLINAGFVFPLKLIWGNASTRKEYDNGFLLTDNNNTLFHLKMIKGKPYIKKYNTTIPNIKKVMTVEPGNKDLIGLAVDGNNQLHVVKSDGSIVHVEIDEYDPNSMAINFMGNMLTWSITMYTEHDSRYYAVDAHNYKLVNKEIVKDPPPSKVEKIMKIIFPLRLYFNSWRSQDIFPRYNEF